MGAVAFAKTLVKAKIKKEKLATETFKKYSDLIDNNNWALLENKFVKEEKKQEELIIEEVLGE